MLIGGISVPFAERYAAHQIKAEIERDGQGSVGTVEVGLFGRRVVLDNFKSHGDGELEARRWEASGLSVSLTDLLEGRTPFSGFRPGDPLRAERVELTDVRYAPPGSSERWSAASIVVKGLDLARYDAATSGTARLPVQTARIAAALTVRSVVATKVVYVVPGKGDTVGIRQIEVEAIDHGKIGKIRVSDLDATPKAAAEESFKVAEIRASALDLGGVARRLASGAWRVGQPLGRIDLGEARASGFGGLLMSQYGVSLDAVSLETSHDPAGSRKSRFRIDGLTFKVGRDRETARFGMLLQAMGLRELALGFDCSGDERRAKGELAIENCTLAAADLANVALGAGFVDADEAFWRAVDEGRPIDIARSSIALGSAKLAIIDKGVIERVAGAVAAATHEPPAATRAKLAQDIRSFQPPDVLITEGLTKLLDTVARFVEQGGTLVIEARPEPPFGLANAGRLSRPGVDLVSLFGLSARLAR
ncbi:MAG: hypothetical protein JSR90_09195 [Proteobacteria bacterium]|nr:hypothetical protein [Pseudomonadota bacterium]